MIFSRLFQMIVLLAAISTPACAMQGIEEHRVVKRYILHPSIAEKLSKFHKNAPQLECEELGYHKGCCTLDTVHRDGLIRVISGSSDGSIKIWDCGEEKRCLWTIDAAHPGGVLGVQISKFKTDNPLIMSYGLDNTIKIWTLDGNYKAWTVKTDSYDNISDACWISADRIAIVVANAAAILNINTGSFQSLILAYVVSSIALVGDDKIALLSNKIMPPPPQSSKSDAGHRILFYDIKEKETSTLFNTSCFVGSGGILRSIDDKKFFIMSHECSNFLYLDSNAFLKTFAPNEIAYARPYVETYGPDRLVSMEASGIIKIYDYAQFKVVSVKVFGQQYAAISAMTTLGDGRIVFCSDCDDTIYIGKP